MINLSSNAIIVKVRARYSKRLSNNDFESLISCSSVSEIASVLKNKHNYCDFLNKISEKDIHRDTLESVLSYSFFEDISILAKYDSMFGRNVFKYILTKFEIQQISKFLIFLKSGNAQKFKCVVPSFFRSESKIKFNSFNEAESYASLLGALSRTCYCKILEPFNTKSMDFDINDIDTRLYNYLFDSLCSSIKKLDRKSKTESMKVLYDYVDVSNVIRIVRLKKFYNLDDDYVSRMIFEFGDYKFSKYDDLIKSNFSDFSFIDNTLRSVRDLEKFSKTLRFKWAKKHIRFSNVSEIVGFSYVLLKEIEMFNLINIIEGVRYGISKDALRMMIVK